MRVTTVKRWVIFIAVLGLIAGTGFSVQRLQIGRLAKSVVEQADNAVKDRDFATAEKLYWEHLCSSPRMWRSRSSMRMHF